MSADWIESAADEDAVQQARDRVDGARFELWERDRLITSSDRSGAARSED